MEATKRIELSIFSYYTITNRIIYHAKKLVIQLIPEIFSKFTNPE